MNQSLVSHTRARVARALARYVAQPVSRPAASSGVLALSRELACGIRTPQGKRAADPVDHIDRRRCCAALTHGANDGSDQCWRKAMTDMATRAIDSTTKRNPARARFAERAVRDSGSWMREVGCALPQPAFATIDEVRYAHELRLQLRARLLNHIAAATLPWSVGVD